MEECTLLFGQYSFSAKMRKYRVDTFLVFPKQRHFRNACCCTYGELGVCNDFFASLAPLCAQKRIGKRKLNTKMTYREDKVVKTKDQYEVETVLLHCDFSYSRWAPNWYSNIVERQRIKWCQPVGIYHALCVFFFWHAFKGYQSQANRFKIRYPISFCSFIESGVSLTRMTIVCQICPTCPCFSRMEEVYLRFSVQEKQTTAEEMREKWAELKG